MEPLSEAALGVLRDKTIGDYLHEHCRGTTVFSKLDHGQKLLDHITEQFELAGLPVPQTHMKSVGTLGLSREQVHDRQEQQFQEGSGGKLRAREIRLGATWHRHEEGPARRDRHGSRPGYAACYRRTDGCSSCRRIGP